MVLSTRIQVQLVVFCYPSTEMKMKAIAEYAHAQSGLPPTLTGNMTQQIEMRAIGKTTEMVRRNL